MRSASSSGVRGGGGDTIMVRGDGVGMEMSRRCSKNGISRHTRALVRAVSSLRKRKNRSSKNEMPILWWASHLAWSVWIDEKNITSYIDAGLSARNDDRSLAFPDPVDFQLGTPLCRHRVYHTGS